MRKGLYPVDAQWDLTQRNSLQKSQNVIN
jgi:hypothetical protein